MSHHLTITGSLLDKMLIITAINRRFEAKFKVPLPNRDGRKMILKYELKGNIGGFQLLDLILTELKSHMPRYNSMLLIDYNTIQTAEQIL